MHLHKSKLRALKSHDLGSNPGFPSYEVQLLKTCIISLNLDFLICKMRRIRVCPYVISRIKVIHLNALRTVFAQYCVGLSIFELLLSSCLITADMETFVPYIPRSKSKPFCHIGGVSCNLECALWQGWAGSGSFRELGRGAWLEGSIGGARAGGGMAPVQTMGQGGSGEWLIATLPPPRHISPFPPHAPPWN